MMLENGGHSRIGLPGGPLWKLLQQKIAMYNTFVQDNGGAGGRDVTPKGSVNDNPILTGISRKVLMEEIIPPVDKELILQELTQEKFLRVCNKGKVKNLIYVITKADSPNIMREVGRLRELSFREAGGGTGKDCDIDEFDDKFKVMIVWDPENAEIVSSIRFACMSDLMEGEKDNGESEAELHSPTEEIFDFSDKFKKEYAPFTIELGRSFVLPKYQLRTNPKSMYSLDNLWDGLGALVVKYPHIKYLGGKVTMYRDFNLKARNLILNFLDKRFPDDEGLMKPKYPVEGLEKVEVKEEISADDVPDITYESAWNELEKAVRALGENIPPLMRQYAKLSRTMKTFGTSISPSFGDVEETGILVTIADIYPEKKARHIDTYAPISQ